MGVSYDRIQLPTIKDILENKREFHAPARVATKITTGQQNLALTAFTRIAPNRRAAMKTDGEWLAERRYRCDEVERKRTAAATPKEERRWRAARDNYKRQITMGRDGLSEAAKRANQTRFGR